MRTAALAFFMTVALLALLDSAKAPPQTILVGQGCEGPSPIAVAYEEDNLPRCARIDRHNIH